MGPSILRVINSIPTDHLLPPERSEVFDIPNEAWTRIQDYAFTQCFTIVTGTHRRADLREYR